VSRTATHSCLIMLRVSEFVCKLLNCVASLQCCHLHNSCFSGWGSYEGVNLDLLQGFFGFRQLNTAVNRLRCLGMGLGRGGRYSAGFELPAVLDVWSGV